MLYNLIVDKQNRTYFTRPAELGLSKCEWKQGLRLHSQGLEEVMLLWSVRHTDMYYKLGANCENN